MEQQKAVKSPRVVIFPAAAQGHVNSMLKLAELLALAGLQITFLNTDHIDTLLRRHTDVHSRHPDFLFRTIPDGLPRDYHRSGEGVMEVLCSMNERSKPVLREMLISGELGLVNCIIADGSLGEFTTDVGDELGIPIIHFRTISGCAYWAYFCAHNLIQAGELPIRGKEDMDRQIKGVPGMEEFLRSRDLPSFYRASDISKDKYLNMLIHQTQQSPRAKGLILNTFEDLEGPIMSHIRTKCPNIYSIGPLNAHLNTRQAEMRTVLSQSNNSLFSVDRSCIAWLDSQPPKSVIYVSFGSIAVVAKDELLEFWHGLVDSHKRFLWVIRPDLLADGEGGEGQALAELSAATKERGFIAGWVPQEEVLAHKAVGGFLTHSGWNSTLESIVAGVPMLCWPYFADQQINSRYVGEVWKLGIDMKDVCDKRVVEKMVNDLMVENKDEFRRSTDEMARLARESVSVGGSSYCNLDRLIKDIRLMSEG